MNEASAATGLIAFAIAIAIVVLNIMLILAIFRTANATEKSAKVLEHTDKHLVGIGQQLDARLYSIETRLEDLQTRVADLQDGAPTPAAPAGHSGGVKVISRIER